MNKTILILLFLVISCSCFADTNSYIIGIEPAAAPVGGGFVGFYQETPDDSNIASTDGLNNSYRPSDQATTSGVVRYGHIRSVADLSTFNCNSAIYNSDGTILLRDGPYGNATSNGNDWYTIQLDSDYTVDDATSYRLAVGVDTATTINFYRASAGGSGASYRQVAGTVAATMPTTMTGGTSVNFNQFIFYFDNNEGIVAP